MSSTPTLVHYLPQAGQTLGQDALLSAFLDYASARGLSLYPAQEEAILELLAGKHVILNTPTGSGKSLVAEALHFKGLVEGKRSFYTCPIKALVNEKFFALCETFGPDSVGMMTGDAAVNRDAKIVCCTAEVLANLSLRDESAYIDYVVMDEFHYYADKERGVSWQIPLLSLPNATFLLMSATLGPTEQIERHIEALTHREVAAISGLNRPVPLEYEYSERPIHETIAWLIEQERAPVYLVNFTQRAAAEMAQALTCVNLCSREEKQALREAVQDTKFDTPYGKDVERFLRAGIGVHHAGILPKYRRLTERLAQKGMLKVICGTDTLGMGINIPLRTVLFSKLCKFDGEKVGIIKVRDFQQIAGRAGRKGFDDVGYVVAQAPEHVIENLRLAAKMGTRKFQKKQPPTKGYVHWDEKTFERLRTQRAEPLESRFDVTFPMMVNLLQADELWPRGGYGRLVELIERSHESDASKKRLRRKAARQFRALERAGLVEVCHYREGRGSFVEVRGDLQRDFSLYQSLSLFLIAAISTLDPTSETYALDLLSFVEATVETPEVLLMRQLDKLKAERMAEMKAQGMDFEDRIAELDKMQPEAPLAPLIFGLFSTFREAHPWVSFEAVRPKSIARDLCERMASFNDYVVEYGLQRIEGVLLRYLTECYKVLAHTVPEAMRDEAVEDILFGLGELIRGVDSSLVDEWEAMREGNVPGQTKAPEVESIHPLDPVARPPSDVRELAKSPKAFAARVRRDLHALIAAISRRDYGGAIDHLWPAEGEEAWTAASLEEAMAPYFERFGAIDLTPRARMPANTLIRPLSGEGDLRWEVTQKIAPPRARATTVEEEIAAEALSEECWAITCHIDLNAERPDGAPILSLQGVGEA